MPYCARVDSNGNIIQINPASLVLEIDAIQKRYYQMYKDKDGNPIICEPSDQPDKAYKTCQNTHVDKTGHPILIPSSPIFPGN